LRGLAEDGARGLRVRGKGNSVGGDSVREEFFRPNLVRVATVEVKIGLDDPGSFAATTSFLSETDRETDVEICLDPSLSGSSSSGSQLIARAAEALVGANRRNLAGSRCGVR
jgi:hypothetical protein